jgi:hypothetical protein
MIAACVLRSGGDFSAEHVQWLAKQVPGLVCLSDVPVPGVKTIPLQYDWPGWWAKMEMFGPALEGDVLMIDLDTVVLGMPERPAETTVLADFTRPEVMGSGFMYVTAADRARAWEAWLSDPAGHMAACQRWPKLGDQGFLQDYIGSAAKWGSEVVSYKVHCLKGVPDGAKVVCFHGKPRPWHVRADWVPKLAAKAHFTELALKHKGKRICVIGGAPIKGLPEADVYISTNAHGVQLREPDYVLAMDERHQREQCPMGPYLRARSDAPIISPHGYGDYRLSTWPQNPRFVLSGMVAAWMAWFMGAKVVILAGMDGYGGQNGYKDEARKIDRDIHCPVRVAGGGPLTAVWPEYDPAETFGRYKASTAIDGWLGTDGLIRVRARKPCQVSGTDLGKGEELKVMRHEVARLLKHRMVEEV